MEKHVVKIQPGGTDPLEVRPQAKPMLHVNGARLQELPRMAGGMHPTATQARGGELMEQVRPPNLQLLVAQARGMPL